MTITNSLNAPLVTPVVSGGIVYADSSGRITTSPDYAFHAALAAALLNATGDGTRVTLICGNVSAPYYNTDTAYNAGTGVLTIPITGIWQIGATITLSNLAAPGTQYLMYLLAGGTLFTLHQGSSANERSAATQTFTRSAIRELKLTAGDTVQVQVEVDGSSKTITIASGGQPTAFYGRLIRPT